MFEDLFGKDAKFFFEGFGEVAEVGEADVEAYLFDGVFSGLQHLFCFFESVAVVELVEFHAIDLFEFCFEFCGTHHGGFGEHVDGWEFIQFVIAEDAFDIFEGFDIFFFVPLFETTAFFE